MISEDQLIPLSALQHYLYCPRQCALIHVEQVWAENRFTAEGRVLHEHAHSGEGETRPGVRTTRGLPIRSFRLGVSGQCDIVEFHGWKPDQKQDLQKLPDSVSIVPVEYKRGKPKTHRADEVQVCAQAMCLEEMFEQQPGSIPLGLLFYGQRKRRTEVPFDDELRKLTTDIARKTVELLSSGQTPEAAYEPDRCSACSLLHLCEPKSMRLARGTKSWFNQQIENRLAGILENDA